MVATARGLQRARWSPASRLQSLHLSAPTGGDDTISPATEMPPGRSVLSYNLISGEYGLRSRLGWREWASLGTGEQVRSLLPYYGAAKDGSGNRLFACTTSGIWDVTSSGDTVGHGTAPTRVVTFPVASEDSGWGASTVFVNAAGAHFLVYTDEANGLYTYAESGAVWTQGGIAGTAVTGVDPSKLVGVLPWKNRLWFVERDSTRGWYLGINAVSGAATSFTFGSRFQRGGDLRCLASWTFDAGAGIDDQLVAISGGGDVVIYQGTDPAFAATFQLRGVWYAGAVPAGRRLTTDVGGDLALMTSTGTLPLSRLVTGIVLYDRSQYQTFQIGNLFNQLQASYGSMRGWAMRLHPQDAALMILAPKAVGQATDQLVMSLNTKGWHRYRDLPMGVCAEPWGGTLHFGTEDGRVCVNDGYLDGVLLSDPNAFSAIDWSLVTAFSNLGRPTRKRIQQIRVKILSQAGSIPLNAEARYNLNMTEASAPSTVVSAAGSRWDQALWDQAQWAGAYQPQTQVFGGVGSGVEMGLAVRGLASSRMTLYGMDVYWDEGGAL